MATSAASVAIQRRGASWRGSSSSGCCSRPCAGGSKGRWAHRAGRRQGAHDAPRAARGCVTNPHTTATHAAADTTPGATDAANPPAAINDAANEQAAVCVVHLKDGAQHAQRLQLQLHGTLRHCQQRGRSSEAGGICWPPCRGCRGSRGSGSGGGSGISHKRHTPAVGGARVVAPARGGSQRQGVGAARSVTQRGQPSGRQRERQSGGCQQR